MLHIILFVLKILGWILLVVLGLFVLVFLLVLFTPLRYQVETRCRGKLSTLEAGVQFHILFHLVSGNLRYEKQKLAWNVRAAWIKLGNGGDTAESEETKETDTEEIKEMDTEETKETDVDAACFADEAVQEASADERVPDSTEQNIEEADEVLVLEEADAEPLDAVIQENEEEEQETEEEESEKIQSMEDDPKDPPNKIASVFEKIKYTFSNICDKIKVLWKKVEDIKAFLENNTHQSAFWKLIAELKKMLFRMRPKQVDGKLEFGFEDPSLTGKVLAGFSMLYPYWEVQLYPNFECKVVDGSISVKGAARLWPAAVLAWNLLWNQDVRRTVMDLKRMVFK